MAGTNCPTAKRSFTCPIPRSVFGLAGAGLRIRRAMKHPIYKVESFRIVGPYTLHVEFNDGTGQTINFQPVLAGELYGALREPSLFNQVRIDPEVRTLVWPNGADFDPALLHDWPKNVNALAARARDWESQPV